MALSPELNCLCSDPFCYGLYHNCQIIERCFTLAFSPVNDKSLHPIMLLWGLNNCAYEDEHVIPGRGNSMRKGDGHLMNVGEEQISGVNRVQGGFGEHQRGDWKHGLWPRSWRALQTTPRNLDSVLLGMRDCQGFQMESSVIREGKWEAEGTVRRW